MRLRKSSGNRFAYRLKFVSKQRFTALFLLLGILAGVFVPTLSAHAAYRPNPSNPHIKDAPAAATKPMKQDYPGPMKTTESKHHAAADVLPKGKDLGGDRPTGGGLAPSMPQQPNNTPRELTKKRTAKTTTFQNADGTQTLRSFASPHFYKNGTQWDQIKTNLIEDTNAADSGGALGRLWGQARSLVDDPKSFKVAANDWQVRVAPSDDPVGMIRIQKDGQTVAFTPVNAAAVKPEKTTEHGQEVVLYKDLWPGIDVKYEIKSDALKEYVILKNRNVQTDYSFTVTGAGLEADAEVPGRYKLTGALKDFAIEPLTISLADRGPIKPDMLSSEFKDGNYSVHIDNAWLATLPQSSFPVVIDPPILNMYSNANYAVYRSDGLSCNSSTCNLNVGTHNDNGWKYWRSMFTVPYSQLQGKDLLRAYYYAGQSEGGPESRYMQVFHASCHGFNCLDTNTPYSTTDLFTPYDHVFDLTNTYKSLIAQNNWGAYMIVKGEEVNYDTLKILDPGYNHVDFIYNTAPPASAMINPSVDGQVFADTEPSFSATTVVDSFEGDPIKYSFQISTNANGTGMVVHSGELSVPEWTVPNDVLQDGTTYYVRATTNDGYSVTHGAFRQFRIDMRNGKDKTQTYDTLGPVNVNLATGNVSTSATSHSSSALGGNLGISLDYNTPVKSRNGLVAEYWNVSANYSGGAPTSTPDVTRVDQKIDFNWWQDSPVLGTLSNDWFYGRWTGYFVAPKTGSYQFGANADDQASVYVNNQQAATSCYSGVCYGNSINLQEGQVVPIRAEFMEATVQAYFHMYVKGAVSEQIVPQAWLQTGVRPVGQQKGLIGRYYTDDGTHNLDSTTKSLIMQRTDSLLSFYWGGGTPIPNGPGEFMTRWTGYFTAPVTGSYQFGTNADDGTKIKIGNDTVLNNWGSCCALVYGSAVTLVAGQSVPITVDFVDTGGVAAMNLMVKGAVVEQVVPSSWLSPKAQVLPDGWNLGLDPDGDLSYERLVPGQNSVILTDSTGSTHEYKWENNGYKPPVNEDGYLVREPDGDFILQDDDGRTYNFDAQGLLTGVTTPVDDRKPAALQYTYSGSPARITQITDGVTPDRWLKVYYSGDSNCGSVPSGFSAAPAGMLCAVKTNDDRATYFYYDSNGQLARIAEPGNEMTDYAYEAVNNSANQPIGYRLNAVRDVAANDAVAAGVRTNDATVQTQMNYDQLGRATSVTQPAATSGATRTEHTIQYLPGSEAYVNGNPATGYYGATLQHITGAPEPNGFSRRVEYDHILRTTKDIDVANLADTTEWDATKDLTLSTTDETGLKSTTIYDDDDRPIRQYGAAPAAWFATDRTPQSTYAAQVPRTDTSYDQGMQGPGVAWHNFKNNSFVGAPRLHTTGVNNPGGSHVFYADPAHLPITQASGMDGIGFSATGKLRTQTTGTFTFTAYHDDAARLWINDQLVFDRWTRRTETTADPSVGTFALETGKAYRFRFDYASVGTSQGASFNLTGPGRTGPTNHWDGWLAPGYNLTTATKTYDSTVGDTEVTTSFGSNPELGLAQSSTLDPTGLNFSTANTYETQGATNSFLRQTTKTLPGGTTTTYQHYGPAETIDNPCTPSSDPAHQGGMQKGKAEADPDGAGSQTARTSETIYDAAGRTVATRFNQDFWTCTAYDARGRVTQTLIPILGSEPARTITNNWAVTGNPLITSSSDTNGIIITQTDLLGRTVQYTDVYGDVTNTTYDNLGRMSGRTGTLGTEVFTYDNYNRLIEQKLDGTTLAIPHYDAYSRLDYVEYSNAGQQRLTIGRDSLGRATSQSYTLGNGTTGPSDSVTRSQSGQIISGTENGQSKSYTYDKAGRLTNATIGSNTYSYEFGAQDSSCGSGQNMNNTGAGKNSNRVRQTINSTTTTYCYDHADRLISSSDPLANAAQYDGHGNTKQIGSGASPLQLLYDSSDRNRGFEEYNFSGNGTGLYYDRDSQGRIIARHKFNISSWNWTNAGDHYYGFTGTGDTPDYLRDSAWNIQEKYLQLPGGVLLTIRPPQFGDANKTYSLQNVHGDIMATTDASGVTTGTFQYDPFGNKVSSTLPANTTGATFAWVGQHEKLTESDFTLAPTQMGARVYFPTLGRFASVDPVEGGVENNYVYPPDPVNDFDLDGNAAFAAIALGALDVGSFAYSANELRRKPTWANAVWFGTELVPMAPGAGLVRGGAKYAPKAVKKVAPLVRRAASKVNRVRSHNNFVRLGKGRLSFGPAPNYYNNGSRGSRIPFHVHLERSKAGMRLHKSGKCIRLWGNWKC